MTSGPVSLVTLLRFVHSPSSFDCAGHCQARVQNATSLHPQSWQPTSIKPPHHSPSVRLPLSCLLPSPLGAPPVNLNGTITEHDDTYPFISPAAAALPPGRAVLVTGASKGVGQALALAYARAGASHIALGARSNLDEVKQLTLSAAQTAGHEAPSVLALALDVQDRGSVAAAAATIAQAFGRLDVVVNNAGALETWRPIAESDPDEWWRTWDVNVRGVYEVTRQMLPLLLKSELKTVVNVASRGAHSAMRGASAYQGVQVRAAAAHGVPVRGVRAGWGVGVRGASGGGAVGAGAAGAGAYACE